MSYSEAKRRQITELALDALEAAEQGNYGKVRECGEKLLSMRRSNPDWVGTTMRLVGTGMQLLSDPRAKAVGLVLNQTGKLFKGGSRAARATAKTGIGELSR